MVDMAVLRIFDIIPYAQSGETKQNAEPSLAIDPLDPTQVVAAAFSTEASGNRTPYFRTTDGGAIWLDYGNLFTDDKSLAWKQDGSKVLNTTLVETVTNIAEINTFAGTTATNDFWSQIHNFNPVRNLDQPWIRTGPFDQVYVTYNDLSGASGKTASVLVSADGGTSYKMFTLDRVGGGAGQDAPSVRSAVNGSTVYAAFTRWDSVLDTDASGETRYNAQVVVVRSDNSGSDGFTALGAGQNGVSVAASTAWFANTINGPLTLGQERTGSDLAITVDPNNANHVVVAYGNAPGAIGSGQLQLIVSESTNGGESWNQKFATAPIAGGIKSALPGLAITDNGTIGMLYASYDPSTNQLSQHLLTTSNDFISTNDITLATESNLTPVIAGSPYIGDFYDLTAVGNNFYGIFSASNAVNGADAQFLNGVTFVRNFIGTPGTGNFQVVDANGNPVAFSIDPYFFSYSLLEWNVVATGDLNGDGTDDLFWQNMLTGASSEWLMAPTGGVGSLLGTPLVQGWNLVASADFNGDGIQDLLWQNATNGATSEWLMSASGGVASFPGTPGMHGWILIASGDFNGDGTTDVLWRNATTDATSEWLMSAGGGLASNPFTPGVQGWHVIATGDFNGDGTADLMWQQPSTSVTAEWLMAPTGGVGVLLSTPLAQGWNLIASADFNGDSIPDLMWQQPSTGATAEWLMAPTGGVGVLLSTPLAQGWNLIATGDFNDDHITDLMWQHASTGATAEWLMAPTGGVGTLLGTPLAAGWNSIATGDFNGDSITDLMWQQPSTGATAEWLMAPTGGVGVLLSTPLAQGWNLIATGDFNDDGIDDLMWQNASSGATAEWLMAPTGGVGTLIGTPVANSPPLAPAAMGTASPGESNGAVAPASPDPGTPVASAGGAGAAGADPVHGVVGSDGLFANIHHAIDIPLV
jgi:FG-GAP-like repeat